MVSISHRSLIVASMAFMTIGAIFLVLAIIKSPRVSPSSSIRAIDSANIITDPTWFKQAYTEGYRLYIMHSTNWDNCEPWIHTERQLKMALDAGLKIAAYTRNPNCWEGGIEATGPYKNQLQFFALDIETDPGVELTRAMVDGVKATGVRPVIYTGSGMWPQVMHSRANDFNDVPLWDADASNSYQPDTAPNHRTPAPVAYGGWNTPTTMRIGVQQRFEYTLNGIKVDLNSFDAQFVSK